LPKQTAKTKSVPAAIKEQHYLIYGIKQLQ